MMILRALESAMEKMGMIVSEEGSPLSEEHWHVGEYYDEMKKR